MLLPATPSMITLANNNLVAPSSWVMERSHPLSPLLALTLQGWDAVSGLPSQARPEHGTTTCIISAYHPSDSSLTQTSSIWTQQCSYLLSQEDPCQPRMAFLHDLGLAISTWQAAGDSIILMADMNCDIQKEEISSFATNLGLQESILAAHPTLLPPITFKRGN